MNHKNELKEGIILAGGLGTRLRDAVPGLPKCLAPVAGRPFLGYVIDELRKRGIERIVFSLGYRSQEIISFLEAYYPTLQYDVVIEQEPLGTGGAIRLALTKITRAHAVIVNGDTIFRCDLKELMQLHTKLEAECTLALKPMKNFDRYGAVTIDHNQYVTGFSEKKFLGEGLVNGGVYILAKTSFLTRNWPDKFSFEKDYLEKYVQERKFAGSVQDGYFRDIGIPEDYNLAQDEFFRPALNLDKIDRSWTLFLDRDGVINNEIVGDYVKNWKDFVFSKGVLEVFKTLSDQFGHIVVVSNQRGVGRGMMKEEDLQSIHLEMQREVEIAGGRIDKIYYCTEKDDRCFNRKPNPGMAFQAARDLHGIDLNKAVMVGNKPSDMRFGRYAGMYTVFIRSTNPHQEFPHPDIDATFSSLYEFAQAFGKG